MTDTPKTPPAKVQPAKVQPAKVQPGAGQPATLSPAGTSPGTSPGPSHGTPDTSGPRHPAFVIGQIALGLLLGGLLVPALLELASVIGDLGVFKYQGF